MITFSDKNEMKIRIAATFMELALKKNYNKISISEIMKPLEVSRQNFYYYFENIDELIEWINTSALDASFSNFHDDKNLKTAFNGTKLTK